MKNTFSYFRLSLKRLLCFCGSFCCPRQVLATGAVFLVVIIGCSSTKLPLEKQECKIQTFINAGFSEYLNTRFHSRMPVRIAVIPFDVPESFAGTIERSGSYGVELASLFHANLIGKVEGAILEVFARQSWPGKRAEYFTGNYQAIEQARNAGYDVVLLGYMDDIVNDSEATFFTKAIDTESGVTIWFGRTTVALNKRGVRSFFSKLTYGVIREQPELLNLSEFGELFAGCTAEALTSSARVMEDGALDSVLPN